MSNSLGRIILLTVFGFLVIGSINPPQAQAIFGLSKCERLEKSIKAEEKIGKEIWSRLNKQRQVVITNAPKLSKLPNKPLVNPDIKYVLGKDASSFYQLLLQIYRSDLKVYSQVNKNNECFSTKIAADVRIIENHIKSNIPIIRQSIQDFNQGRESLYWNGEYEYITKVYRSYVSVYSYR